MAFLYVPGLVGSTLALLPSFPATAPSVTWRGNCIAPASWRRRWKRALWMRRLSGMTCGRLTQSLGVAAWISSMAGSLVSRFPPQEGARATKTLGTSGPSLPVLSASYGQLSLFSKTCRGSCHWDCETCAPIYAAWVTTFRQASLARQNAAHHTCASASLSSQDLWPTPTVGMATGGQKVPKDAAWCGKTSAYRRDGSKVSVGLGTAAKKWPTPTASNRPYRSNLLSPVWVERLMGFPDGWTDGKKA